MTVVCSSCNTRYAIADGRVQDRAFRVRCRRCGNVILHQPAPPSSEAEHAVSVTSERGPSAAPAPAPAPEPQLAPCHPERPSLTAARHEQSVLFSLGNLQALALSSAPRAARRESGLIDIHTLAANVASDELLPDTAGVLAAFVPPVLLPAPARPAPWILPATIAMGSALVLSLLALTAVLLLRPSTREPPPSSRMLATRAPLDPRPAPPVAPAPASAPAVAPAAAPSLTPPAREPRVAVSRRPRVHSLRTPPREVTRPSAGAQAPAAAPDPIGKLIDDAVKQPAPVATAPRARAPERQLPEELTKEQIVAGMRGVRARVQACYDRYRVAGTASVRVSISPEGHAVGAKVGGRFAGTPTGQCLSLAVQAARFPRFRGPAALTIPEYPFILQ